MLKTQNSKIKIYDLEERTLNFSRRIIHLVNGLPKNSVNFALRDQVLRSGTSVGSNYREANETETKKDFLFRMRICRKEAKETVYWIQLIIDANQELKDRISPLYEEANELVKIIATIIENYKKN